MECEHRLDNCDEQATCIDTIGSYTCSCNSGWTGNGFSCEGNSILYHYACFWEIAIFVFLTVILLKYFALLTNLQSGLTLKKMKA